MNLPIFWTVVYWNIPLNSEAVFYLVVSVSYASASLFFRFEISVFNCVRFIVVYFTIATYDFDIFWWNFRFVKSFIISHKLPEIAFIVTSFTVACNCPVELWPSGYGIVLVWTSVLRWPLNVNFHRFICV